MISAILLFPLLPLMTCFELVKRVIGLFVYPMSYYFVAGYIGEMNWWRMLLWLWMDDSINMDALKRGEKPRNYCIYGKREPLGFITEHLSPGCFQEFARAYNWGAVRNSAINLRDKLAVGRMVKVLKHFGGKSFYEVRLFPGIVLPYLELWIGRLRIQCGWLSGGFFQVQARRI